MFSNVYFWEYEYIYKCSSEGDYKVNHHASNQQSKSQIWARNFRGVLTPDSNMEMQPYFFTGQLKSKRCFHGMQSLSHQILLNLLQAVWQCAVSRTASTRGCRQKVVHWRIRSVPAELLNFHKRVNAFQEQAGCVFSDIVSLNAVLGEQAEGDCLPLNIIILYRTWTTQ